MDFDQLSLFLSLARCRQFTEAAAEESVSQSTLSKQIKSLEEELGVKLFKRSVKGVELSPAGRDFYEFARNLLENKRRIVLKMAEYIEARNKQVAVGVIPVMASYGIAELIAVFRRKYPQFSLSIAEESSGEIKRLLAAGALNMALLGNGLVDLGKYREQTLLKDEIVLVAGADHPLASESCVALQCLAEEPFILLDNGTGLDLKITEGCKKRDSLPISPIPAALSLPFSPWWRRA
jgi:DNA-binding transcriptional LysR family regulator